MYYYIGLLLAIVSMRGLSFAAKGPCAQRRVFFVGAALLVIAFQGARDFSVGTDIAGYMQGYSAIGNSSQWSYQNYEFGYLVLNKVFYFLGFGAREFLAIVAALIQVPIFYTLYKHAERPLFSVLIYFAFGNFYMTFSGLRQSIAMALCFFAYSFIKGKRPVAFAALVLLAALFHTSAIICLVLYPLYHHIRINADKMPFAMIILFALFLSRKRLIQLISLLYYGTPTEVVNTGSYTMFLIYLALYLASFLIKRRDKDFQGLRNILLLLIFINCFASVHNYVARLGFPLTLYLTLYIPQFIQRFRPRPSVVFYPPCYVVCILFFLIKLGSLGTLPFRFFF